MCTVAWVSRYLLTLITKKLFVNNFGVFIPNLKPTEVNMW